jgi:hypothetical protein
MKEKKFKVGNKGTIEENIERLQKELGDVFESMEGAPKIKEDSKGEEKEDKRTVVEKTPKVSRQKFTEPLKTHATDYARSPKKSFKPFKSSKFYITFLGILSFTLIILKTPVFKYTTPFRQDDDLPQIEVGFRYYNNILGKQTRVETIVKLGMEEITVPFSMSEWVNMDLDKKLLILKYLKE